MNHSNTESKLLKKSKKYAICLFVYNRPKETAQTLQALSKCVGVNLFDIICFCDAPKGVSDNEEVEKTLKLIRTNKNLIYEIHVKEKNIGLKDSIISGISYVKEKYDGFVVLEDDIVLEPSALKYAHFQLEKEKENSEVFHINIWNFPIINTSQSYYSQYLHCWGWASWSNRWIGVNTDSELFSRLSVFQRLKISKYLSTLHVSHLYANYVTIRKTWAIFWLTHIILKRGKCVSPPFSLAKNIGFETGEHREVLLFQQKSRDIDISKKDINVRTDRVSEIISWVYAFAKVPKLAWLNSIRIIFFK